MDELPEGKENQLTEVEEWELQRKMLDLAFHNSYLVITNKTTFEDLMYENHKNGKSAVLAHDPHEGPSDDEMENLIEYFVELEEYEMCGELVKSVE